LALASHTGWQLSQLQALRISRLMFWIEGLPKDDE
jgi:hypothetical protein